MKRETRHPIWSWIIHTPWVLAVKRRGQPVVDPAAGKPFRKHDRRQG